MSIACHHSRFVYQLKTAYLCLNFKTMPLEVSQLTKIYGQQRAVDNLNFEVAKGEIVGFLGPNGAGKSTTMKILTCYIPPTAGQATVCGYNVLTQPLEAKRQIGYLPEQNPLYLDMYVHEYLHFVGHLHKIPARDLPARVREMVAITGLEREQKKKIGALSKGYKQRVGLAQAMLHNPQVLILDEPTSGLDPNQLVEIRGLIKQLGAEKTVLLSSHILQEVAALCTRVIIINKGQLVANDTPDNLQNQAQGQSVVLAEFDQPITLPLLQTIPNVQKVEALDGAGNRYYLYAANNTDLRPDIFKLAVTQQRILLTLHRETSTLEDIFRQLTTAK
jgi:ABC-2 type transport system ATP-binding protein